MSTTEENKAQFRRAYEEVLNEGEGGRLISR